MNFVRSLDTKYAHYELFRITAFISHGHTFCLFLEPSKLQQDLLDETSGISTFLLNSVHLCGALILNEPTQELFELTAANCPAEQNSTQALTNEEATELNAQRGLLENLQACTLISRYYLYLDHPLGECFTSNGSFPF